MTSHRVYVLAQSLFRTLKEKIGCCSKLDGKIWHRIFNWMQQPIFGCVSQPKSYDIEDKLTQPKIGCSNQKLAVAAN